MKPSVINKFLKAASLFSFFLISSSYNYASVSLPVLRVDYPASDLVYDYYIDGTMILEDTDGTVIESPVKLKTRGATALLYKMKPSFNMKLETPDGEELDNTLLGLRKASSWILDAMAIDRICMRNRVCFDIWNEYSKLPYDTDFDSRNGTVGKFVIVYMNDEYKGIYCLSDKINRKLLDLKKPKEEGEDVTIRGVLYKNGTQDISNQETVGFYNDFMVYVAEWHDAWELKEPDNYPGIPAWQPLIDYYENRNQLYIEENFDVNNLIDYSLLVMALCIKDNWGNKNKYFSMRNYVGDKDDRKFVVTPWDLDTSLGGHYNGDYYDGQYSVWTMQQIANSSDYPFSICFTNPDVWTNMKQRWAQIRETALSVESVANRMYEYCELFEESGAWQQYVDYWNTKADRPKYVSDLRKEIDLIVEWYADRFNSMDEYFDIKADNSVSSISDHEYISPVYNLQGLRIDSRNLVRGQIYIHDGKKFIAK